MTSIQYIGSELTLFQHAVNWKRYYSRKIARWLQGDVLEVGGGLGATAQLLCTADHASWTSLEPDQSLAAEMQQRFRSEPLPAPTRIVTGVIDDLPAEPAYDSILYIDVLEHIEHDHQELRKAASRLRPGGALIVLSPAHQSLFSEFDQAIGHFRRYSARTLAAAGPQALVEEKVFYLDSVGMLASLANRLLLRSSMPTIGQIKFWDTALVPPSRLLDPLLFHRVGKSVVAIWSKPNAA